MIQHRHHHHHDTNGNMGSNGSNRGTECENGATAVSATTAMISSSIAGGGGGNSIGNTRINNRDLLMLSLSTFYSQRNSMARIIPIVDGMSDVSLRLVDWFVTNYAKKNNTILARVVSPLNTVHFNVYLSYRSQLKAYSKQQFDPFRRRDRILFYYEKTKSIETTIGQLNFFRWVLQNDILDYISDNIRHIEADMIRSQKRVDHASRETRRAAATQQHVESDTDTASVQGPDIGGKDGSKERIAVVAVSSSRSAASAALRTSSIVKEDAAVGGASSHPLSRVSKKHTVGGMHRSSTPKTWVTTSAPSKDDKVKGSTSTDAPRLLDDCKKRRSEITRGCTHVLNHIEGTRMITFD